MNLQQALSCFGMRSRVPSTTCANGSMPKVDGIETLSFDNDQLTAKPPSSAAASEPQGNSRPTGIGSF